MALEDYRADMERCSQCSYCKWIPLDHIKSWRFAKGCPSIAYSNFLSYSARGRYNMALSLLKGDSTYSDRVVDVIYKCNTCGSCDVSDKICRYNLEPLEMIHELRFKAVEDGQVLPQHKQIIDHLLKENNVMLQPAQARGDWAEGLGVKNINREPAAVLFHAGCRYSYDKELQKTVRTAVSVLKQAGVDIGIMGAEESCCGAKAYDMGYKAEFLKCAEANIQAWKKSGVKTIVTSCADCYHAFLRLYPSLLGEQIEVLHTVQYVEQLVNEGKIKFSKTLPLRVTYHDPCHLGRQGEPYVPWKGKEKKFKNQIVAYDPPKPRYNGAWGIYEPPRNILKSIPGIELVEMERIREYAWCCGAGGGSREAYPEYAAWVAQERIEEAKATGANAIVSACGWCERNFLDGIQADGCNMKVFDVIDLVQQAL
ncbi:MAG: (Fe-S)-binding protein [Dehalococcoidales bacterium]|nr:(Fe-S)-binding protein [Dehalococcoidales bacterium]